MPEPISDTPGIFPARPEHLDAVLRLLQENDLPGAGVAASFGGFFVALVGTEVVGVVGIETADGAGMVRSLAVRPDVRGRGIAHRLVQRAEDALRRRGVTTAWLLTETAPGYFALRGYDPVSRHALPEALAARSALAGICPCSCACMRKGLTGDGHLQESPEAV